MNTSIPHPFILPGLEYKITEENIFRSVLSEYKLKRSDLNLKTRKRRIVEPRSVAMTILTVAMKKTVIETGEMFNKDHSTCSWARKTTSNLYFTNRDFQKRMDRIINEIIINSKQKHEFYEKMYRIVKMDG